MTIYTIFTEPDYKVFVDLNEVVGACMGIREARVGGHVYYLNVVLKNKEVIQSTGPKELIAVEYENLLRAMSDHQKSA